MGPSIFIDGEKKSKRKQEIKEQQASMGPSIFIDGEVEPAPRSPARSRGTAASMGPSIFIDGERFRIAIPSLSTAASMGPSIFIDGELDGGVNDLVPVLALQWGRRSSSTERSGR